MKITDIPKDVWELKINVQSPEKTLSDETVTGADLDVFLMPEKDKDGKTVLPYFTDLTTGCPSDSCTAFDEKTKTGYKIATGKVCEDGSCGDKDLRFSCGKNGCDVDPNYAECIAGFDCMLGANGFDPDDDCEDGHSRRDCEDEYVKGCVELCNKHGVNRVTGQYKL